MFLPILQNTYIYLYIKWFVITKSKLVLWTFRSFLTCSWNVLRTGFLCAFVKAPGILCKFASLQVFQRENKRQRERLRFLDNNFWQWANDYRWTSSSFRVKRVRSQEETLQRRTQIVFGKFSHSLKCWKIRFHSCIHPSDLYVKSRKLKKCFQNFTVVI